MIRSTTDLQLALAAWVLAHQRSLRRSAAAAAVGFILVLAGWSGWQLTMLMTGGSRLTLQSASALTDASAILRNLPASPAALIPGSVTMIPRDGDRADIISTISNPNESWGARVVRANLAIDGASTQPVTTFVNQGSTQTIVQRNVALSSTGVGGSLTLGAVDWARGTAATIPPPVFRIDDLQLSTVTIPSPRGNFTTARLKAVITNRSVFGWHAVQVPIVLYRGETAVGAELVTISEWASLEAETVTVTWPYPISGADRAEIAPQVNRFDTGNTYRT